MLNGGLPQSSLGVIALAGMPGVGKSSTAKILAEVATLTLVKFGDYFLDEATNRDLPAGEAGEAVVRKELRQQHGAGAAAIHNWPKIEAALKSGRGVVIDSVYSSEEFDYIDERARVTRIAIHARRTVRESRLSSRAVRPLNASEIRSRDTSELETSGRALQIAMADFHIVNDGSLHSLSTGLSKIIKDLR